MRQFSYPPHLFSSLIAPVFSSMAKILSDLLGKLLHLTLEVAHVYLNCFPIGRVLWLAFILSSGCCSGLLIKYRLCLVANGSPGALSSVGSFGVDTVHYKSYFGSIFSWISNVKNYSLSGCWISMAMRTQLQPTLFVAKQTASKLH